MGNEPDVKEAGASVLAVSMLFPNCSHPNRGIFVANRLEAVSRYADVTIINPIPWFPFHSRFEKYAGYDRIPKHERVGSVDVYHPRYLGIPYVLKSIVAVSYCFVVVICALKLRKKQRFALVDLHWTFPDLPAGYVLSKLLRIPYMVTIRGGPALGGRRFSSQWLSVRWLLPRAHHVITLSDVLKERCVQLGVDARKINTVRNGVDPSRFYHVAQESCRKRLGLPLAAKIVLGVGYLTHRKGFDRIIQAVPDLYQRFPALRLYLIGPSGANANGDCTAELKTMARDLGVEECVQFVGDVPNDDLRCWYNAADCFCLSSRDEGCPNVLLEALACGCPVVATDVGAVRELVEDESCGFLAGNHAAGVHRGLASLLERRFDREAIAARTSRFDWDWCARQVADIYLRLLRPGTL